MAWYDFITGGADKLVSSVGNAIDSLSTTDEEKLQLKAVLEKQTQDYKLGVLNAQNDAEKELTERLKADMVSDSWLSKNIRPLALAFLTISTVFLIYATIFLLKPEDAVLVEAWTPLLTALLITAYSFYFGSRGFEKSFKIKNNKTTT